MANQKRPSAGDLHFRREGKITLGIIEPGVPLDEAVDLAMFVTARAVIVYSDDFTWFRARNTPRHEAALEANRLLLRAHDRAFDFADHYPGNQQPLLHPSPHRRADAERLIDRVTFAKGDPPTWAYFRSGDESTVAPQHALLVRNHMVEVWSPAKELAALVKSWQQAIEASDGLFVSATVGLEVVGLPSLMAVRYAKTTHPAQLTGFANTALEKAAITRSDGRAWWRVIVGTHGMVDEAGVTAVRKALQAVCQGEPELHTYGLCAQLGDAKAPWRAVDEPSSAERKRSLAAAKALKQVLEPLRKRRMKAKVPLRLPGVSRELQDVVDRAIAAGPGKRVTPAKKSKR